MLRATEVAAAGNAKAHRMHPACEFVDDRGRAPRMARAEGIAPSAQPLPLPDALGVVRNLPGAFAGATFHPPVAPPAPSLTFKMIRSTAGSVAAATNGPRNALLRSDVSPANPLPEVVSPHSVRVPLPIKSREHPFRLPSFGAEWSRPRRSS